jgi:hypothetical protein
VSYLLFGQWNARGTSRHNESTNTRQGTTFTAANKCMVRITSKHSHW